MNAFLEGLLVGGPNYRVTLDIGGAVFAPPDGSTEALENFQSVANKIHANDGLGYNVQHRLTHKSADYGVNLIDRMIIKIHK